MITASDVSRKLKEAKVKVDRTMINLFVLFPSPAADDERDVIEVERTSNVFCFCFCFFEVKQQNQKRMKKENNKKKLSRRRNVGTVNNKKTHQISLTVTSFLIITFLNN
jgi:hypothetical protein